MAKKQLNVDVIRSELTEGSAFFRDYRKKADSPAPEPEPVQTDHTVLASQPQIKPEKRKQISAYLTPEQLQTLKTLHFTLNNSPLLDTEIEKSDIVALGIECVSALLGTQVPKYSNTQQLRTALLESLTKYLSTQVPKT